MTRARGYSQSAPRARVLPVYKDRAIGFAMAGCSPCIRPLQEALSDAIPDIVIRTGAPACGQVAGVLCHAPALARTIGELASADTIAVPHIAEAL